MNDMIILWLLVIAVIFSFRLDGHAKIAAFTFAFLAIMHELLSYGFDGFWYSITDAFTYLFIAAVVSKLKALTFITHIIDICIIAVVLDIGGYIAWSYSVPVDFINNCFVALYVYACGLIWQGRNNADIRYDTGDPFIRFYSGKDDIIRADV